MISLVLTSVNHLELQERPVPKAEGDVVVIKIAYAGICGTDLHAVKGEYAKTQFPIVLGHELSGVVVDVGCDVKRIKVGERVTCETAYSTCNHCIYCKTKDYNLCSSREGIGTSKDGAYAQYLAIPECRVHLLPHNVDYLSGALTEPLACGVHAVIEKADIQKGEVMCVFGVGAIGLMVAQVGIAVGAKVIITGLASDRHQLELAEQFGAIAVDQSRESLDAAILKMTDGNGVNAAFECSGSLKALEKAFDIVQKKGRIIQMGVFQEPENKIPTDKLLHREIALIGSRSQKPSSWVTALKLMSEGVVQPEKIVKNILPLTDWKEAFAQANGARVVFCCNGEVGDDFGAADE